MLDRFSTFGISGNHSFALFGLAWISTWALYGTCSLGVFIWSQVRLYGYYLREFVRTAVILGSRRVSGWFRTALHVPFLGNPGNPGNPLDLAKRSNLLEFEIPTEVERLEA